jgi:hypothetical protein
MATLFLALQCVQCSTMQARAWTNPNPSSNPSVFV